MKEHLSLFDLIALTINTIIGIGVFLMPSSVLHTLSIGGWSLLSLAIAFVFILFIAYSYMLLGSIFQRTGGEYIYISRFLEPFFGFIDVWILNLSSLMFLVAEVKLLSALLYTWISPYLSGFRVHIDSYTLSTLVILMFAVLALSGNKGNNKVVDLLFVFLLSSFLLIIAFLGVKGLSHEILLENFSDFKMSEVLKGAFLMMWLYFGFNIGVNVGEEVKGKERNVFKGVVYSLIITFFVYFLLEIFIFSSFRVSEITKYDDILSLFSSQNLRSLYVVSNIAFVIVLVSKIPSLLTLMSRRFYAWGRDKILPEIFGALNQKRGVPWFSITFSAFLAILFLSLDFSTMDFVFISTIAVSINYFLMNLSALMLKYRKKRIYRRAKFRISHDTIIMIIGAILSLSLLYNIARINLFFLIFALLWFILGTVIYIWRRDIHLIKEKIREEIHHIMYHHEG